MNHLVLWCLTSKSFCKGIYKFHNLQLLAEKLTLFCILMYWSKVICPNINELLTEVLCE